MATDRRILPVRIGLKAPICLARVSTGLIIQGVATCSRGIILAGDNSQCRGPLDQRILCCASNYRAGSDPSALRQGRNPNDPNMITTGAYGDAFNLALQTVTDGDKTTERLTYQSYKSADRGSFSAVSETGSGKDLASAYQSLMDSMTKNGELDEEAAADLKDAYGKLDEKSQHGKHRHDCCRRHDARPSRWTYTLTASPLT